jgi:hypothetical protein
MTMHPISALELRVEVIPRSPLIEKIERDTGQMLTHEHRHYLEGQPVHCGDTLEMYREGQWTLGRYEWSGEPEDSPTFHFGHDAIPLDDSFLLRWPR